MKVRGEGYKVDIVKIIKNYSMECSAIDKKISDYILANLNHVYSMSIYDLASELGISTASISRYAKKIGFNKFADLKQSLMRSQILDEKERLNMVSEVLDWGNDYDSMRLSIVSTITEVCTDVFKINSADAFYEAVDCIKNAETIYLTALGSSSLSARDLQHKLMRLQKRSIYLSDTDYGLQNLIVASKKDLIIAISFDGKTPKIVGAVKGAKSRGVKVLSITRYASNPVEELADISLFVPNVAASDSSLSSIFRRYGQLTVVDFLYVCLAKQLYSDPEKHITEYNKTLDELNRQVARFDI